MRWAASPRSTGARSANAAQSQNERGARHARGRFPQESPRASIAPNTFARWVIVHSSSSGSTAISHRRRSPVPRIDRRPLFTAVLNAPCAEIRTWPPQQHRRSAGAHGSRGPPWRIHHAAHQRASTVTPTRTAPGIAAGCRPNLRSGPSLHRTLLERKRFGPQLTVTDGQRATPGAHSLEVRLMKR